MASSISRRLCRSLFSNPTFKPSTPLPPQLSTRFFCSTLSSPENSDSDNSTVEPPDPTPDYDSHTSPSDSSQQQAFYDRPLENGLDPGIYKVITSLYICIHLYNEYIFVEMYSFVRKNYVLVLFSENYA